MGKKGKKTRWRRLPIGGTDEESGLRVETTTSASQDAHRVTFNEDEYTKITTPRQDVLFKKGYFSRKRNPPNPSPSDTQEVQSADSAENESYISEEPQYAYPTGYVDPTTGVYYVNGNTFETYDPYMGTMTVVVGPPVQYPGGPPVLAAVPCQPVPLQPVEWFNPTAPWCYSYNRRKRYSTDSQNCSAQSSESTGPPGSPQEPVDEGACAMYPPPQYMYPGYMFGPPIYNMNGVTVQGVVPQPVPVAPDMTVNKRRKKRRRRRRGGVTDDGSESSCYEEQLTCDMVGCQSETSQSGASSDGGVGPNSDSGINTNSGSNSPPLVQPEDSNSPPLVQQEDSNPPLLVQPEEEQESHVLPLCSGAIDDSGVQCEMAPEFEVAEELSTAEDDVTPNLCTSAPESSSQESTLSCLSTPSATKDLLITLEQELTNVDISQEEVFDSCSTISIPDGATSNEPIHHNLTTESPRCDIVPEPLSVLCSEPLSVGSINDLKARSEEPDVLQEKVICETEKTLVEQDNDVASDLNVLTVNADCDMPERSTKPITENDINISNKEIELNGDSDSEKLTTSKDIINYNKEINEDIIIKNADVSDVIINEKDFFIQEPQNVEINENINATQEESKKNEEWILCTEKDNMKEAPKNLGELEEERNDHLIEVSERIVNKIKEVNEEFSLTFCIRNSTETQETSNHDSDGTLSRLSTYSQEAAPVPPPRRKKSMNRVADRVARRVVEEAIKEGVEEAAHIKSRNPLSITEAVTRWLNSHESSPLTFPASDSEYEDDEGIEVEEEDLTGQKNVRGNPFLASSHSDAGQRVANDCESIESSAGEWDMWDHSHTQEMCDPTRSVDKYYRLGADDGVGDRMPPSVYKTAMQIRHTGPFPCGVCCIIQ